MGKITPRDPASGLPTGKRMHKPIAVTVETAKAKAPRDSVSGNATGRRAYKAVEFSSTEHDGFEYGGKTVKSPRDAASGLATGKRQHKPF